MLAKGWQHSRLRKFTTPRSCSNCWLSPEPSRRLRRPGRAPLALATATSCPWLTPALRGLHSGHVKLAATSQLLSRVQIPKPLLFTCFRASSSRAPCASFDFPPFASACRRKERTSHDGELPHRHRQLCCRGGNGHADSSFRWRWGRRDGHRGKAFRSTCEALRGHSS